eukprot:scaffold61817_cov89-Cyclotella_meneghiniana.AAC.1
MNERERQRTAKDFQSWAKSSGKENNWEMIGSGRFSVPHTLRVKPVGAWACKEQKRAMQDQKFKWYPRSWPTLGFWSPRPRAHRLPEAL